MRALSKFGNVLHVNLYRLTGGRLGGSMFGVPVVLVTSTGNKTGRQRTTPLMGIRHDGHLHVIASAGGAREHPAWYRNVEAHQEVTVRERDHEFAARAVPLEGDERDAIYAAAVQQMDRFAAYQNRAGRVIPVVRLEPVPQ